MLTSSIDVSIILINYNTTLLTIRCIEAIKKYTSKNSYEIILIDNASGDKSILNIPSLFPDVKFVANDINVGFGRANNIGIGMAKGKYVFLLNTDAFLISDAIFSFWSFMENANNATVACCGGDLVNEEGKRVVSYGNFPSLLEAFSSIGFCLFYYPYYKRNISGGVINYSDKVRRVDFLCGADLFIRKSVLSEVGVFDPSFFMYFEETDLSLRICKAGYKSFFIPSVQIIHLEGGSQPSGSISIGKVQMFAKSRNIYFTKHKGKVISLFVKLLYATKAAVYGLVTINKFYLRNARIILHS